MTVINIIGKSGDLITYPYVSTFSIGRNTLFRSFNDSTKILLLSSFLNLIKVGTLRKSIICFY